MHTCFYNYQQIIKKESPSCYIKIKHQFFNTLNTAWKGCDLNFQNASFSLPREHDVIVHGVICARRGSPLLKYVFKGRKYGCRQSPCDPRMSCGSVTTPVSLNFQIIRTISEFSKNQRAPVARIRNCSMSMLKYVLFSGINNLWIAISLFCFQSIIERVRTLDLNIIRLKTAVLLRYYGEWVIIVVELKIICCSQRETYVFKL